MSYHIAFIGLGIMGNPMALNLLNAGHQLSVYARRENAMRALVLAGATPHQSPKAASEKADFVITMVSDTSDVEEVILKDDSAIIHGAKPGTLVIDTSSISPLATRDIACQLARKKIDMIDAPVSGGEIGAKQGNLSIMVGGSQENFTRALPILRILGQNIVRVGDNGAGQVAKACNQIVVAQTIVGVAEAYEFARAADVNPAAVRDALLGGFAYSRILEVHGKRMLDNDYSPGFKAKLHLKDMNNVVAAAASMRLSLAGAEKARDYLQQLADQGDGELDSVAMAKIVNQEAKTN